MAVNRRVNSSKHGPKFSLAKRPLIQIQKVAAQLQRAERDDSMRETGQNTKKRVLVLVASHSYDLLLDR